MNNRQEEILQALIEQHIASGAPVSSSLIVDKAGLGVSSATIRNEMANLEQEGYIQQPHTSAGRIPTEKAYHKYIGGLSGLKIDDGLKVVLSDIDNSLNDLSEYQLKQTAKQIASATNLAVFWAFHRHNVYYTGVANLLSQPEFDQHNLVCDISLIIDRLDDIVNEVFDEISFEPHILLGNDSPFGSFASAVVTKYRLGDNIGLIGILGPMRMDYSKNMEIIKHLSKQISNIK